MKVTTMRNQELNIFLFEVAGLFLWYILRYETVEMTLPQKNK